MESICLGFTVLFIYAATSKLMDLEGFQGQLAQSDFLSPYAHQLAWAIPISEITVSGMLLIPILRPWGLYAALGLMTIFTIYIVAMLHFSAHIPCSCGGMISALGWKSHLIFNLCCMALALWGIGLQGKQKKTTKAKNTT